MSRPLLHAALVAVVAFHIAVVLGMVASFFVAPFMAPWYLALPACVWIWTLATTRNFECRLTQLENTIRKELGLREVTSFIGHYFMKHLYVLLGVKRASQADPNP